MLTKAWFHHSKHCRPVRNAGAALTYASAITYRLSCLPNPHVMPQKKQKTKTKRAKRAKKKDKQKKEGREDRREEEEEKEKKRGDETRRKGSGALGGVWGRQGTIPGAGISSFSYMNPVFSISNGVTS